MILHGDGETTCMGCGVPFPRDKRKHRRHDYVRFGVPRWKMGYADTPELFWGCQECARGQVEDRPTTPSMLLFVLMNTIEFANPYEETAQEMKVRPGRVQLMYEEACRLMPGNVQYFLGKRRDRQIRECFREDTVGRWKMITKHTSRKAGKRREQVAVKRWWQTVST